MVTPLLLLLAAPPSAPHSILVDETFAVEPFLQRMPSALSYGNLLENFVQPVIFSIEESGGFSNVDPAKFSLYGDSWVWNHWYVDDLDLTDPLFSGAAAFAVPFRFVERFEVVYAENPHLRLSQGIRLTTHRRPKRQAGAVVHFPNAGGLVPLGPAVMNWVSGTHALERSPAPPKERRRFGGAYQLHLTDGLELPLGHLAYAVQIEDGDRRFLSFTPSGDFESVFEEDYFVASGAAVLTPAGTDARVTILGEYRTRDRAFAELYYAPEETFIAKSGGLLIAATVDRLRAGLTFKRYLLEPNDRDFVREIFDPDGEALRPFRPGVQVFAAKLDLRYGGDLVYFTGVNRFLVFTPTASTWVNQLTAGGEPYGTWRWRSAKTTLLLGDDRLGIAERLDAGALALSYDLSLAAMYATNRSGENGLGFVDLGAEVTVELDHLRTVRPFLSLAKTPIAPSVDLASQLDPAYLDGELRLTDGRLIDTTGGARTRLADRLGATNIYSAALGTRVAISREWSLAAQGILKAYHHTYRLQFDGGAERYGSTMDGIYYLDEGEKRYVLENTGHDLPFYFGAHFGLVGLDPNRYVVSVGFSAYNAVGYPVFGNGVTANDVGLVDPSTANPNTSINQKANLDGDRGFHLKMLLGYRFLPDLWGFITFRHRDGQPFTFIDAHEHDGQIAFTHRETRGSPLKLGRPLSGPREDAQFNLDLKILYQLEAAGLRIDAALLFANLLDFGNELQEVNGPSRPPGRPALESQIPRSILLTIDVGI